jgi:hypothetical protein
VPTPPPVAKRPTTLLIATAIVLFETVALWVYVVLLVVATADEAEGWRVTGFVAMWAVALAFLSVGLVRRRMWTRAPLIVLQLLLSVIGFSLMNGMPAPGAALVVLTVVCVGLLLVSQTREALS